MNHNLQDNALYMQILDDFWHNNQERFANRHKLIIFDILLTLYEYGDVPSVVAQPWQVKMNPAWYSILSKISLAQHSVNVAYFAMREFDSEDRSIHVQDLIIASLGHDIAKNQLFRNPKRGKRYLKFYHAWDSADVIRTIIAGRLPDNEVKRIFIAIYNHHSYSKDRLTNSLQIADERARAQEGKPVGCEGKPL